MNLESVQVRLRTAFPEAEEIRVQGEGNKISVLIVSPVFAGLRPVQKQQKIYGCMQDWISSGELHAVTMQTLTPDEWKKMRMFA